MKKKIKITQQYIDQLPDQMTDGLNEELKTAETDPFILRKSLQGLRIDEDEERVSIARMSTRDIDSDNEIIIPFSLDLSRYQSNPIVLVNHNWSSLPVGSTINLRAHDRGIDGKIKYADTPRANEVWSLVKDGHLRANSIGFAILDYVSRSHRDFGGMVDRYIKEWEEFTSKHADRLQGFIRRGILLENSVVTIPANANALMEAVAAKSLDLSDEIITMMHIDQNKETEVDETVEETDLEETVEETEVDETEVEEKCQPKLVARLVRRAEKSSPKIKMTPKLIKSAAQDAIDLKLGKV